jgi:hypothetical protein
LRTEWSRSRNLANDLCRPSVYISTQRARRVVPVFFYLTLKNPSF